jgi:hypothetical protein
MNMYVVRNYERNKGPVAGSCEHSNELLGALKGGKFID